MKSDRLWRWVEGATAQALLAMAFVFFGTGTAQAGSLSPTGAGAASLIVPGAGQAANGDYGEAAAQFGIFTVSVYGALHYHDQNDFLSESRRYDESNNREFTNGTTLRYDYATRLMTDTALYSSYAAYRDARQRDNSGYRRPAPDESLGDLAAAPFSFRYLSRPTTFVPLLIQAAAAFGSHGGYGIYRYPGVSQDNLYTFNVAANEMTAVGEEALFRGFFDNEFSDRFGDRKGLVLSSVIFGLSHTGQGNTANALQATAAGFYLGWLHQRNGFEAGEGVALHYWFNVLAGISAIRNGGSAQIMSVGFSF